MHISPQGKSIDALPIATKNNEFNNTEENQEALHNFECITAELPQSVYNFNNDKEMTNIDGQVTQEND